MSEVRPRISVCIVTYNQRDYIKDAVLSAVLQDCDADVEILVGDDRSTDDTGDIVQGLAASFPGRVFAVAREKNLGASANYQDLIGRASGDYIAHLDGDDYWMPGKLAAQLAFMQSHPECAAVYSNGHAINVGGALIGAFNNSQPELFDIGYLLRKGNFLAHSSMIYRAVFRDEILGIRCRMLDYRMHLRLARRGPIGYIDRDLVAYRVGTATSEMVTMSDSVRALFVEAVCDPDLEDVAPSWRASALALGLWHGVFDLVRQRRYRDALGWIALIRRRAPSGALMLYGRALGFSLAFMGKWLRQSLAKRMAGHRLRILYGR